MGDIAESLVWLISLKALWTPYGLFKAGIWFIWEYLNVTITIFSTMVNSIYHENVKTDQNYGPHFGVRSKKGSHIRREPVKTKPANKHVRTRKYRKKVQDLCLLSITVLLIICCSSFSSIRKRLSFYTLFAFFSWWLLKKCSSEWTFVFVNQERVPGVSQLFPRRGYNRVRALLKT